VDRRERLIPYRTMKSHPYLLVVAAMFAALTYSTFSSCHAQVITVTPSLTGGGLPPEIKLYTYNYNASTGTTLPGTGFASTGLYQGRDSLIIGTGSGNSFSRTYWNLGGPLAAGATEGSFSISMYDAYGGASQSPYYMNFILYSDQNVGSPGSTFVLGVGWQDFRSDFNIVGPGVPEQWFAPSLGWNDFRVDWSPASISVTKNGSSILQRALTDAPVVRSIEVSMHDVNAANRTIGASGISITAVPEPSTYALLLMTGAGALWWARRRR
jgi:hypothetical protein